MNLDHLEQQLQRQPIRGVPPDWRAEILGAAHIESRPSRRLRREPSLPWWHSILWPSPQAWIGVAAVWVVILALQFTSSEAGKKPSAQSALASGRLLELLKEQQSLFAELVHRSMPVEPPKPALPRPRGENRSKATSA